MENHKKLPGTKTPFPQDIIPMLATLTDEPVDGDEWLYELKWDGYRTVAYLNENGVDLKSRNNKSFNDKFYPVYEALKKLKLHAVLDGEIVVLEENGKPDFSGLQAWRSEADGHLVFYVFDIVWLDGNNLMEVPLEIRRDLLKSILIPNNVIKISENFTASGKEFFEIANKKGLEGIMAKKASSLYLPGLRSKEWLKIKTELHQEAIIGGYTKNENTSKLFSALLLGLHEGKDFKFIGTVGTGFSNKLQLELIEILSPFVVKKCPFDEEPDFNKPSRFRPNPPKATVTWVKPEIICEISYRELTRDGSLRHPSFRGIRSDKSPKEVIRETPIHIANNQTKQTTLTKQKILTVPGKKERNSLLNPTDEQQTRSINNHELKFGNLSKIYWPEEKITKRDLLNYYYQVAPFILPYLVNRPQTLNRYPHGIDGQAFYQKDVKGKVPEWIMTFPYHSDTDGRDKEFIVCSDEASLLYIASLGCIEMNPWSSTIQKPDYPDWCIIDLDPDKNTFKQVIDAANLTKQILDQIGITSFPKTSGSTGLHIYIPLGSKFSYEESKEFGRTLATMLHKALPKYTSIERKTADRDGKMYIDFLQNRPQATIAAPYSVRPKKGATVSMPLLWEEIKTGLKITDFTIHNSISRIKETGDLFKGVLGKGVNLKKAHDALKKLK